MYEYDCFMYAHNMCTYCICMYCMTMYSAVGIPLVSNCAIQIRFIIITKSPQVMSETFSSSSISLMKSQLVPVVQVVRCMYALMRIEELCLTSAKFYSNSRHSRELVHHLSKLKEDTVLRV